MIGGGPSAMSFACHIDTNKYDVYIYEKNAAIGRKFLVAGDGGFNLTHSEDILELKKKYVPAYFLDKALESFDNSAFRRWLKLIGIETYVGTSKRVFPVKSIKPIKVLNTIKEKMEASNISILYNKEWKGWSDAGKIVFSNGEEIDTDITVFSLGGASWPVTGSSGDWISFFKNKGIAVLPFEASNCAFKVDWPKALSGKYFGKAIKNAEFSCGNISRRGEAVVTNFGIEGSGVYALSSFVRRELNESGKAMIYCDFKPSLDSEKIKQFLMHRGKRNITEVLKDTIKLSDLQIALLKGVTSKEDFQSVEILTNYIKQFPISITGLAPIEEAISTVGGISLDAIDENFQLKNLKNNYCIGEMLNWDAPTGGYLLQACFSMGKYLADHLNKL